MLLKYSASLVVQRIPKRIFNRKFSTEPPVLTREVGNNAVVIFNRPKSLNAMTLPLQHEMLKIMKSFEKVKSLIIIKGAGDRALSAGGDLLKFKEESLKKSTYVEEIYLYVHTNIYLISRYTKPVVVFMNGYAVGGAVGYSVYAKYRVVTEKTKLLMPEVRIGSHPNASGSYFLNQAPGKLGLYLGLTGNSLEGADVLRVGYGTHFCKSNNLDKLEEELLQCSNEGDISKVLDSICEKDIPEFSLKPMMDKINNCFSASTIEGIIEKLEEDGSPWAEGNLRLLKSYSPTSLKVTLRQFQRAKDMSMEDVLVMEASMSVNFYNFSDIYEGTRVILEDKNDTPKWNPSKLSDVTEDLIESHFKPILEEKQRKLFKEIDERHISVAKL